MDSIITSDKLRHLRFTKRSPNRRPTPIAIPTPRTRPPTAPPIDLTRIDQSSAPASDSKRPFPQFGSAYSPFKSPRSTNRRPIPPKQGSTIKQSENDHFADFQRETEAAKPPKKKFKPIRVGKPQTIPSKTLQNRSLAEILEKARPAVLSSTSSGHLSANRTHSPVYSTSARASSTSSRGPNTDTDSSRSASTSKTPLTRTNLMPLSQSSKRPPGPKALSSRKKLPNDTGDCNSVLSSLSDLQVPTRSPSSSSGSVLSKGKEACQPSVDLMADIQNTLSVMGMSLQTDRPLLPANYHVHDFDQTMPEDLSLELSEMIDNPESLCPFCDEPLPQKPSTRLIKMLKYLKNTPGVTRRKESQNPFALYLPFSKIASYCQQHRAERKLIPTGIKKGWPSQIDFKNLPNRINKHRPHLYRVCTREVASDFMEMALKEWIAQGGRKAQSVAHELATFQVEQPGYYGVRGYEVIYHTLQKIFQSSSRIDSITQLAKPMSLDFLLRKVLIPETALCLIADDLNLKVTDTRARTTLEDSRAFGMSMFPDEDDFQTSLDSQSPSESEDKEQSSPLSLPKPPHLNKKRPRPSESCEIEIIPCKKSSPLPLPKPPHLNKKPPRQSESCEVEIIPFKIPHKACHLSVSPDNIEKNKLSSQLDRGPPCKQFGTKNNRPIYPPKALKDGWKATPF